MSVLVCGYCSRGKEEGCIGECPNFDWPNQTILEGLIARAEKTEATLERVRALIPGDQQSRLVERIRAALGLAPAITQDTPISRAEHDEQYCGLLDARARVAELEALLAQSVLKEIHLRARVSEAVKILESMPPNERPESALELLR